MRLENWSIVEVGDKFRITGQVYENHNFIDGTFVTTSYIVGQHDGKIVTFGKSLYELVGNEAKKKKLLNSGMFKEVPAPPVNRIKCLNCNTILESHYRHDFQECDCSNGAFVDGGLDYQRVGGSDMLKIDVWDNNTQDWKPAYSEAPFVASQSGLVNKKSENTNIIYKIQHIPTGLYFRPDNSYNLSEKGKIYLSRPNIKQYTKYANIAKSGKLITPSEFDWKVVKFKLSIIED